MSFQVLEGSNFWVQGFGFGEGFTWMGSRACGSMGLWSVPAFSGISELGV